MSNKKDYFNKCFSPNWIEVDLEMVSRQQKEVLEVSETNENLVRTYERKDSLETKQRKDLNTLLKELDEIKQNIERVAEKQHRLKNLMSFYTGEFAR
jgi:flagellar motility protein MotE (MotC chaperone)